MNSIALKKNWIHFLWLFILIYPMLSLNFGFPFLGNIITSALMLAIAIGGFQSIFISAQSNRILHRQYSCLYFYNILLFSIGFTFIPNLLYFNFYISFFISILLLSMFYYFNANLIQTLDFIQKLFKYTLPIYLIILIGSSLMGNFKYDVFHLSIFTILYLFVPTKSKIMVGMLIATSFFSIILNTDFRALILLNLMGGVTLLLRIKTNIPIKIIKIATYFFLILPIAITILSVITGWNPFTILDGSSAQSFSLVGEKIVMSGDSRSFLYKEIYNHLCKYNALLWGTTPGIGYQSSLMFVDTSFYDSLRHGRIDTEVGILEFFHFGGIINVSLLFSVFVFTVQTIFKNARNRLAHIAALYLSFRWLFLFMEGDIIMTAQWLGLLIILGFFSNKKILRLTDKRLNIIFNKKFSS